MKDDDFLDRNVKAHRDPMKIRKAHSELAKLGIAMPPLLPNGDRASRLEARAECRRALNELTAADPKNERGAQLLDAFEVLTSAINENSGILDALDASAIRTADGWRDAASGHAMQAIGREHSGKIAAELGARRAEFSLGDFFRGVAGLRTTEAVRNSLSVGTGTAGGYTVPLEILPQFLEALIPASSVLKAGGRVMPLEASAATYRLCKVASVPTAGWRSEGGALAQSDPAFDKIDLTPQSLAFYFAVSRELLADSINIDAMLSNAIAGAFAKELDRAALRGSGALPEPRGLLNIANVNAVTNGANGTSLATIKWANLTAAYQAIATANAPTPTAAIMHPRTLVGFANLADTIGQPLERPDLIGSDAFTFVSTSQIPVNLTVGTSSDCSEVYVGDFTRFIIGMRQDISIMRADQLLALNGQIAFVCHARVDFAVDYPEAFALVTGVRP